MYDDRERKNREEIEVGTKPTVYSTIATSVQRTKQEEEGGKNNRKQGDERTSVGDSRTYARPRIGCKNYNTGLKITSVEPVHDMFVAVREYIDCG
jgi:hypothetical protein